LSAEQHTSISEDKRATEYLANERTFLAWVRTGIAVISLGFLIAKFSVWLRELATRLNPQAVPRDSGASLPIGLTMMGLGGVLVLLAARRYWVVNHRIEKGKVSADHGLIILVTAVVLSLAIGMIIYMVVSDTGQPAASLSGPSIALLNHHAGCEQ
jgi:putative membrane protein